jgi:hypothetical protein
VRKLLTILFFLPLLLQAQITDTTTFSTSGYSFFCPACGVYPKIFQQRVASLNHSGFKDVTTFGATINNATADDAGIKSAFAAAVASTGKKGVYFPPGNYVISQKLLLSLTSLTTADTLWVYAYGATLKFADLTINTFLQATFARSTNAGSFVWLGGKFDGNQFGQKWPYNPHGGTYDTRALACSDPDNQGFAEAHSCILAAVYARFALFKDIDIVNTVLDGIRVEGCKLGIVADCTASGGAPVHENLETQYSSTPGVCEQGSYFKYRVLDDAPAEQTAYFLNLRMDGGSIGIQFSAQESTGDVVPNSTGIIANCYAWNQAQDNFHIEDCYKNFIYNTTWGADAVGNYMPRFWVSNKTRIASFENCHVRNGWINFVNATRLILGFVDKCEFSSEYTSGNSKCSYFVNYASHVSNSSFTGRANSGQLTNVNYSKGNRFININSKALDNVQVSDADFFQNGTNPVNLASGGHIYRATSSGVTGLPTNTAWTSTVDNPFKSKLYIRNQNNQFIGNITIGQ